MNKTLFKGLMPTLMALALTACSAEDSPMTSGTGCITPDVNLDSEVLASARSARAGDNVTVDDLTLTLSSEDGSFSDSWHGAAAFPADQQFKIGKYTLTASYGAVDDEGFDKPCYIGSADLTVTENNTTRVALTATMANCMVSVDYSESFKNYMTDWSAELHAAGGEYLYYGADETRPVYLRPGATTLSVSITKPNGSKATLQVANFVSEPRHHYHLTVDLKDGAGDAVMVISFDESLDLEDVEIELSDELMNAPAPTMTAVGFTPGEPVSFVASMPPAISAKVNIMARGQLASVMLTTKSKSLIDRGWPEEVDLMATPENIKSYLRALGFDCVGLWKNPDKMAVVDFSNVLQYMNFVERGDNVNSFTLLIKDRYNKVSEPMTFEVDIEALQLEISDVSDLYYEGDELNFNFAYNGIDIADKVKFQMKNTRGTWDNMTVKSIEPLSRSGQTYHITLAVPADDADLTIRALCGNVAGSPVDVKRKEAPFALTSKPNDTYTNTTMLSLAATEDTPDEVASQASLYLSADGGEFVKYDAAYSNGLYKLSGLKPGTAYKARIAVGDIISRRCSFTTESMLQIPNGNLDAEATKNGSGSNWENYVFEGWGTNNAMTTSQGADYAYVRISGTKPTSDSHSGQAVALRTNGWGSGNSAAGSISAIKYIDAGLLHLGATRTTRPAGFSDVSGSLGTDDLECGIDFESRPSSISFWYKYTPKNSADYGTALARVIDAAGNVIAEGSIQLTKQDNYVEETISFTYPDNCPKAAKLYVRFMSTGVENAVKKSTSWLTYPSFGNLSRGESSGSTLYIDDVTLNY